MVYGIFPLAHIIRMFDVADLFSRPILMGKILPLAHSSKTNDRVKNQKMGKYAVITLIVIYFKAHLTCLKTFHQLQLWYFVEIQILVISKTCLFII